VCNISLYERTNFTPTILLSTKEIPKIEVCSSPLLLNVSEILMGPGSLLESGAGTGVNADELLSS
jgi:hypothetical protein